MNTFLRLMLVLGAVGFCSFRADAVTWHVATNGNDAAVGTNWVTALKTIQVAVNKAGNGDAVIVSNGLYNTGGRHMNPLYAGDLSNRVAITNAILVQSANGPDVTTIQASTPSATYLRCVYLASNATLVGFTLTGGKSIPANAYFDQVSGGAVFCEPGAVLSNCTISSSYAYKYGGGVYLGTLFNCTLVSNRADTLGGGAYQATLINCSVISNSSVSGGGVCESVLTNCTLIGNAAYYYGGGAYGGTLSGCAILSNSASYGGGVYGSDFSTPSLKGCTLSGNSASGYGGGAQGGSLTNCVLVANKSDYLGGGTYGSALYNCLLTRNAAPAGLGGGAYLSIVNGCTVYGNTADVGGGIYQCNSTKNSIIYSNAAASQPNYASSYMTDCCTTPYSGGNMSGTIITNDPQLVNVAAGNYRLSSTSPCIDAGSNAWVVGTTDLGGSARIFNSRVDMGAYEYNPDGDGDGLMDTDEAIAGTNPLDSNNFFRVSGMLPNAPGLQFDSVTGRLYSADHTANLAATPQLWTEFTNNIPGTGNPITLINPATGTNRNFRIRVRLGP